MLAFREVVELLHRLEIRSVGVRGEPRAEQEDPLDVLEALDAVQDALRLPEPFIEGRERPAPCRRSR